MLTADEDIPRSSASDGAPAAIAAVPTPYVVPGHHPLNHKPAKRQLPPTLGRERHTDP
jgi:hypothetical protein